jgi:hypothetical protein
MITDWSHPTWDLFHVIAHKVVKTDAQVTVALGLIKRLCQNLPCPVCREHAKKKLSSQSLSITTPKALAVSLWQFHNSVNRDLGKHTFPWASCIKTYREKDITNVIGRFDKAYTHITAMLGIGNLQTRPMQAVVSTLVSWTHHVNGSVRPEARRRNRKKTLSMTFST